MPRSCSRRSDSGDDTRLSNHRDRYGIDARGPLDLAQTAQEEEESVSHLLTQRQLERIFGDGFTVPLTKPKRAEEPVVLEAALALDRVLADAGIKTATRRHELIAAILDAVYPRGWRRPDSPLGPAPAEETAGWPPRTIRSYLAS